MVKYAMPCHAEAEVNRRASRADINDKEKYIGGLCLLLLLLLLLLCYLVSGTGICFIQPWTGIFIDTRYIILPTVA